MLQPQRLGQLTQLLITHLIQLIDVVHIILYISLNGATGLKYHLMWSTLSRNPALKILDKMVLFYPAILNQPSHYMNGFDIN